MKFEVLKRNSLKRNIIVGAIVIAIISAVILNFTRAKYRVTESIPLVNGTINYSLADFNAVAIYIQSDNSYKQIETIPESGYALNEEESYCKVNNIRDDNISLSYDVSTKTLNITPMITKGTKCYLYFDEQLPTLGEAVLANASIQLTRTFPLTTSSKVEASTTGTIYKSKDSNQYDDYGEVYYFAGNPTDNWIKFAGFYWRIIRINGDGSIRMIYQGTSANTTGTNTQISTSAFNSSDNRSEYAGLKYTTGSQRGTRTNSTILTTLNNWYSSSGLSNYADDIDSDVGFCGDRNMGSGYTWSSQPSSTIYYAAYDRLVKSSSNVNPSFKCSNSGDLYKIPVGLITADEVIMGGLLWSGSTTSNYLYTGEYYWTMSPSSFNSTGNAVVFYVSSGDFLNHYWVNDSNGIRPVINLKADVTISSGNGTSSNPYVI